MPYIPQESRPPIDKAVNQLPIHLSVGEFNYAVSRMCDRQLKERGLSYTNINNLIGTLECIKLELYRRLAANYEDQKLQENGDAYSLVPVVRPALPAEGRAEQGSGAPGVPKGQA